MTLSSKGGVAVTRHSPSTTTTVPRTSPMKAKNASAPTRKRNPNFAIQARDTALGGRLKTLKKLKSTHATRRSAVSAPHYGALESCKL